FSKIEAGKLSIEESAFSLDIVLENLVSLYSVKANEKSLDFSVKKASDIPGLLKGDPMRLEQVLGNLVSNAVKFTDCGSVSLEVDMVRETRDKVQLRFSVSDTGIGLESGQMENVFQAFTQADGSFTRKYGGTGLGLSICRHLITLMGGEIVLESAPGKGSRFYFDLAFSKAKVTDTGLNEASETDKSTGPIPWFGGCRALVVEDNRTNQQVARELLEAAGVCVTLADNGEKALKRLAIETFDLVLMDIQMPVMDGFTATKEIRGINRFQTLPIIAMTAHAMVTDREKCLATGMNSHLTKPIDPDTLYATLSRWLPPSGQTVVPIVLQDRAKSSLEAAGTYISVAKGLEKVGHNVHLFHKLLKDFREDHRDAPGRLARALEKSDCESAVRLAHTLRGAAGNLGARELSDAAARLESALSSTGNHWEYLDMFNEAFERVMGEIAILVKADAEDQLSSEHETDWDQLSPLMGRLRDLLSEANPEAVDLLPEIRRFLGPELQEDYLRLANGVDSFQFDEAVVHLDGILRKGSGLQ
ncbi:MAG: ATP-binding protein, partial [Desulfobacterales bacterium]|nr:ATP-binding protein [Desulfobacterales bacterium]